MLVAACLLAGAGKGSAAVTRAAAGCPGIVDSVLAKSLPRTASPRDRLVAAHGVIVQCVTRNLTRDLCPSLAKAAPIREVRACLKAVRKAPPRQGRTRYPRLSGLPAAVWAEFSRRPRPQGACRAAMTEILEDAATARWFCAFADREVTDAYYSYLKGKADG